jgi:hypothetical protein
MLSGYEPGMFSSNILVESISTALRKRPVKKPKRNFHGFNSTPPPKIVCPDTVKGEYEN